MTDPPDVLGPLRKWRPAPREFTGLDGAVDPHRSDEHHLLFSPEPCRGSWIRIPTGALAGVEVTGEVRCGPVAWPRVRLHVDPDDPASATVVDAVGMAIRVPASVQEGGGGALLQGAGDEGDVSRDVHVEIRPEGKLYRIRLQVEGHDVRDVSWDAGRKVYVGDIPGIPVEDALDVYLQAWGSAGAALTCSVEVDGRALEPPLDVRVGEGPGEGRRSYRL